MKIIIIFLLSLLAASCANQPSRTIYAPYGQRGGYIDDENEKKVLFSTFFGNAYTTRGMAEAFAEFRANEVCREKNLATARVFDVVDLTTSKAVQKAATTIYSDALGSWASTDVWSETYTFPTYSAVYICTENMFEVPIKIKSVPKDDMKSLVKDLLGAVQVTHIFEGQENKMALKEGDIISKVNGKRVQNVIDFIRQINQASNHTVIALQVFREGTEISVKTYSVETTQQSKSRSNEILDATCPAREMANNKLCIETGRRTIQPNNNTPLLDRLLESTRGKKKESPTDGR